MPDHLRTSQQQQRARAQPRLGPVAGAGRARRPQPPPGCRASANARCPPSARPAQPRSTGAAFLRSALAHRDRRHPTRSTSGAWPEPVRWQPAWPARRCRWCRDTGARRATCARCWAASLTIRSTASKSCCRGTSGGTTESTCKGKDRQPAPWPPEDGAARWHQRNQA